MISASPPELGLLAVRPEHRRRLARRQARPRRLGFIGKRRRRLVAAARQAPCLARRSVSRRRRVPLARRGLDAAQRLERSGSTRSRQAPSSEVVRRADSGSISIAGSAATSGSARIVGRRRPRSLGSASISSSSIATPRLRSSDQRVAGRPGRVGSAMRAARRAVSDHAERAPRRELAQEHDRRGDQQRRDRRRDRHHRLLRERRLARRDGARDDARVGRKVIRVGARRRLAIARRGTIRADRAARPLRAPARAARSPGRWSGRRRPSLRSGSSTSDSSRAAATRAAVCSEARTLPVSWRICPSRLRDLLLQRADARMRREAASSKARRSAR